MASSGTMPNGSYQGVQTTASAEPSKAGSRSLGTAPSSRTRPATPSRDASSSRRRASGSRGSSDGSGPPAISSSAPGSRTSASMMVSYPLRGTSRPTLTSRTVASGDQSGETAAATPDRAAGWKRSRSTPHGIASTRPGSLPRASSSVISSRQVAMIPSACRTRLCSTTRRCAGEESSRPWWRRFTTPRAWKVTRYGSRCVRAARWLAQPDIQKWACRTSTRSRSTASVNRWAKVSMCGQRSSFASRRVGPAGRWATRYPFALSGAVCSAWSLRV